MQLPPVTDEFMMEMRGKIKNYAVLLLKATPKRREPGADAIVREHGRRNHALRLHGVLSVVCPVTDGGELCGVGLFNATPEEVTKIMEGDPGVQAGIFTYEVHPVWGFPGDKLP
jgi:hypothetical protein